MNRSVVQYIKFWLAQSAVTWPIAILILPIFTIVYVSFTGENGTFSLKYYFHFLDYVYTQVIGRSFFLAFSTMLGTLLLGYPIAYYVALCSKRYKLLLLLLLTLPFWTNFIVQVYAWFFILEKYGLLSQLLLYLNIIKEPIHFAYNIWAVLAIMIYCYLPFAIMPMYSSFEKVDIRLLDASMDLGATRWQTFFNITLPLTLSGIKTGALLVFVPAFGEFVIPTLLGGSKYLTAGALLSYYYIETYDIKHGATFTVLVGCSLLLSVLFINQLFNILHKHNKGLTHE
ncbi:ABC transporter permease [bacterium]|nr:MAG: ABC transporter permease [bacterium]QQR62789.1 MAG: ABC transporter permease [bacterium]